MAPFPWVVFKIGFRVVCFQEHFRYCVLSSFFRPKVWQWSGRFQSQNAGHESVVSGVSHVLFNGIRLRLSNFVSAPLIIRLLRLLVKRIKVSVWSGRGPRALYGHTDREHVFRQDPCLLTSDGGSLLLLVLCGLLSPSVTVERKAELNGRLCGEIC
jgi:hypothetical protein